jgi:riboflavin synthase
MFTGIVEALGQIESVRDGGDAGTKAARGPRNRRIVISTDLPLATVPKGGSIAVNGVCLTLVGRRGRRFEADLGPETLARTTLATLAEGDRVHLERALRLGDPLGGHLVSGHVDGVGTVVSARKVGDALELEIDAPAGVASLIVEKGSICVDGVSLTVNRIDASRFAVMLIPHTLDVTALGGYRRGQRVNLEADLIAKHVDKLVNQRLAALSERKPSRAD